MNNKREKFEIHLLNKELEPISNFELFNPNCLCGKNVDIISIYKPEAHYRTTVDHNKEDSSGFENILDLLKQGVEIQDVVIYFNHFEIRNFHNLSVFNFKEKTFQYIPILRSPFCTEANHKFSMQKFDLNIETSLIIPDLKPGKLMTLFFSFKFKE